MKKAFFFYSFWGNMKSTFYAFRSNYSYEEALALQGLLSSEGYIGLLAFECPETITFGRASEDQSELKVSQKFLQEQDIALLSTDRGGNTLFHGPGQLVGFPIVNLKQAFGDAKAVKRFSEELLMGLAHACAVLGVKSVTTRQDYPGLWTSRGLLASVGINVKDGHVFHGFYLNVHQAVAQGYSLVSPMGLPTCPITSLEQEGVRIQDVQDVAVKILPYLSVIQGELVKNTSRTLSFEDAYSNLVSTVSRSQMAMDHLASNLKNPNSIS
jgi:lipoyl(octanoyl) transferase